MLKTSYCDYLCSVAVVMNFDEGRKIVNITRSGKKKIKKIPVVFKLFRCVYSLALSHFQSRDTVNAGWFIWAKIIQQLSTQKASFSSAVVPSSILNSLSHRIHFSFEQNFFSIHFSLLLKEKLLYLAANKSKT
jgi:hypothetical protein